MVYLYENTQSWIYIYAHMYISHSLALSSIQIQTNTPAMFSIEQLHKSKLIHMNLNESHESKPSIQIWTHHTNLNWSSESKLIIQI